MYGLAEWGAIEYGSTDGIAEQLGTYTLSNDRANFNGFSLGNNTWKLKRIPNLADAVVSTIDVYDNPKSNGQTITSYYYRSTQKTLRGSVVSDTEANLTREIDSFLSRTYRREANLDIFRGEFIRRYLATLTSAIFSRADEYPLYRCEFELTFDCRTPFGTDVSYTFLESPATITEASRSDIGLYNDGSAGTPLVFYVSWTSATGVTSFDISSNQTDEGLNITEVPSAGDIWLIDGRTKTITKVNTGTTITAWTGTFIELQPETNTVDIAITSTSHAVDLTFKYLKSYL